MLLFEDRSSATKIYIELTEKPKGGLTLSGHDIGEAPRQHFGNEDYEYAVTVPADAITTLAMQLLAEKYRNDPSAVSKLKKFCDENRIPCSFWSYP